jgi:hypothetical protein
MPREQFVQISGRADLTDEGVLEALSVVVPMSEPRRDLADAPVIFIEQGGVRVAEYVPRHPLDMEWAEGGTERMARLVIRAHQGQIKILKDELRALGERYDTLARACLRPVDPTADVPGAPDVQVPGTDVLWNEREHFTDPEPREQAEQGNPVPRFTQLLDDYEQLAHRDVVLAPVAAGDARPLRWKW